MGPKDLRLVTDDRRYSAPGEGDVRGGGGGVVDML